MQNEKEQMKILESVLTLNELHMMKILIEDVKLHAKGRKIEGVAISTNIGVPQGDCVILFTIYLAKALEKFQTNRDRQGYTYCKKESTIELVIYEQYADDISWITDSDD